MTTTTARKSRISGKLHGLKDLSGVDGNPEGTFEAIVAVFGNVDYAGDRIVAGAFGKSLDAWEASGDPIPVLFSHQWDNLDAHIGEVLEAKELLPGDPLLPTSIKANGGLWTKFRLEVDEDFAGRVSKKLKARTLKEFSFAYDVVDERRAADGANELLVLDVIEVGPTLKGMNPSTVLLARKALEEGTLPAAFADALIADLKDLGAGDLAEVLVKARAGDDSKAWVTLAGSDEERHEAIYAAAWEWASDGNVGNGGFYGAYLEATFADHVVVLVEGWDDPYGEGSYWRFDYTLEADGTATLGDPQEVALEATAVAKSRAMKHYARNGSAPKSSDGATVSGADEPGKVKGKGGTPEDPAPRTGSDGDTASGIPAETALDLDLLEAGIDPTDSTL